MLKFKTRTDEVLHLISALQMIKLTLIYMFWRFLGNFVGSTTE